MVWLGSRKAQQDGSATDTQPSTVRYAILWLETDVQFSCTLRCCCMLCEHAPVLNISQHCSRAHCRSQNSAYRFELQHFAACMWLAVLWLSRTGAGVPARWSGILLATATVSHGCTVLRRWAARRDVQKAPMLHLGCALYCSGRSGSCRLPYAKLAPWRCLWPCYPRDCHGTAFCHRHRVFSS